MIKIDSKDKILEILNNKKAVLIYFSANECNVCKVLKPKIEDKIYKVFPKIKNFEVNSSENSDISTYFNIFSSPTILVFFEGKEFKRYSRNISLNIFEEEIERLYKMVFEK